MRSTYLDGIQAQWRNHRPLGVLADHTVWASDVRSQDVFVSPCLRAGPNPEDAELRVDTLVTRLRQRRLVAVLGDVGSGKSTLRLWCAHELAADAGGADAGIPVLLHARALQHRTSLRLVDLLPDEARVFERSRARWYLLVDGIDEVGGSIWPYLAELRRTNPSILGILATSRPAGEEGEQLLAHRTSRRPPAGGHEQHANSARWRRSPRSRAGGRGCSRSPRRADERPSATDLPDRGRFDVRLKDRCRAMDYDNKGKGSPRSESSIELQRRTGIGALSSARR